MNEHKFGCKGEPSHQNSSRQDISKLVRTANKDLHLGEGEMHAEAESIFQSVGKTLKKRREIDDHEVMTSYLQENETVDPAHGDLELEQRLQESTQKGKQNMAEYLDNFYRDNVIKKKDKQEEEDKEDEEVTEDEVVEDEAEGEQDENESTSVSVSDAEGDTEEGSGLGQLPNPKATSAKSSKEGQKETEKGVSSSVGDLCISGEVAEKSIEKCFADTSNIENEVPKETTNVKDTPIL